MSKCVKKRPKTRKNNDIYTVNKTAYGRIQQGDNDHSTTKVTASSDKKGSD